MSSFLLELETLDSSLMLLQVVLMCASIVRHTYIDFSMQFQ